MTTKQSMPFEPLKIGSLTVPGRVYKTATAETRADDDGYVTDELLEFYAPLAWAGTPLIITGNLFISRQGKSSPRMTGVDDDDKIPGLARLADLVHGHGSHIFGQLNHCGRQVLTKAMGLKYAVSPSDVRDKLLGTKPRPMTIDEIHETVDDYASAAERCRKAGFDGIQIHVAHGYLINQFLTPYTNRRRDEYGGSFENRMRFLREVYSATRERVGDDYPIILKINGSDELPGRAGLPTADFVEAARIMELEGVNGVEVSVGHYESGPAMVRGEFEPFFKGMLLEGMGNQLDPVRRIGIKYSRGLVSKFMGAKWPYSEGFNLEYAREFKKVLSIPVICVGGFVTREGIERAIADGDCDAVSCARSMIADPLLYRHLQTGVQGPLCNFCNGCIGRAGTMPVDCYDEEIGPQRHAMLDELDWTELMTPPGIQEVPAANPKKRKAREKAGVARDS